MDEVSIYGYTPGRVGYQATSNETRTAAVPEALLRATRSTRGRLRLGLGLAAFAQWFPFGVLFLTPWALSYRFEVISAPILGIGLGVTLLVWGLFTVRAVRRGPGLLQAALVLDRTHELKGRLAAALEYAGHFSASPEPKRDAAGYMSLALAEAQRLGPLSPKRAAPVPLPPGIVWGGGMLFFWALLLVLPSPPPPVPRAVASAPAAEEKEEWLLQDDAELLERAAEELKEVAKSDEGKDAAARFNEIVLRAAAGEIDQAEAFRLAAELQADLEGVGNKSGELIDGLSERGETLEKRAVTRPLGQALREKQFKDAEDALKKLAERLASGAQPLSEKELAELRESLEEMRGEVENQKSSDKSKSDAAQQESQKLEERQKRLLEKKQKGTQTEAEKREFAENERRLKSLSREKKRKEEAQKTLSDLDKQLAEAAKALQKEQKKAGEFMDQAAQTLKKGVDRQLSDEEKRELLKQLKAMKDRLRRQNQDGKQSERLREFMKRARGKQGEKEGGGGKPQQGQGKGPGQMQLGPGGTPIPVPGSGEGQGQGQGEGQQGEGPGGGQEAGKGHDPNLTGEESRLAGAKTEDTTAVAQDTGQGESASETILGVAEEGFTTSSYENLYREYQTVAEDVMEKEAVPAGRRAHVLRYFELIRPRGAGRPAQGDK